MAEVEKQPETISPEKKLFLVSGLVGCLAMLLSVLHPEGLSSLFYLSMLAFLSILSLLSGPTWRCAKTALQPPAGTH